jgi:hypothetical protein
MRSVSVEARSRDVGEAGPVFEVAQNNWRGKQEQIKLGSFGFIEHTDSVSKKLLASTNTQTSTRSSQVLTCTLKWVDPSGRTRAGALHGLMTPYSGVCKSFEVIILVSIYWDDFGAVSEPW